MMDRKWISAVKSRPDRVAKENFQLSAHYSHRNCDIIGLIGFDVDHTSQSACLTKLIALGYDEFIFDSGQPPAENLLRPAFSSRRDKFRRERPSAAGEMSGKDF